MPKNYYEYEKNNIIIDAAHDGSNVISPKSIMGKEGSQCRFYTEDI
jgi:hypothetical protein